MRETLSQARRIVVKVGTSSLTGPDGALRIARMEVIVRQLAALWEEGREVLLVSSGAIGAGLGRLGLPERPAVMTAKQALAAVGQGLLMHRYESLFGSWGCPVGQVLLTWADFQSETRRESAAGVLRQLLEWRVIPIVNENDTVSYEEIRVGDNDTLSARVATLVEADLLILLTDVEGFYREDPRLHPELSPLDVVAAGADLGEAAGGAGTANGTGGMRTKLQAARIAAAEGIPTVVASGGRPWVLKEILAGERVGTLFLPEGGEA
jgi:glutamate 5-kinase